MLYIIRHGKTDWNALYKMQGKTDIPLNEEGRQMARAARDEYADIHFDICFASPLIRARETAELLLEGRDIPIIIDKRLEEMGFGVYEGECDIFKKPESPMYPFFKDPANYKAVEGGESMEELFARTGEFMNQVVKPLLREGKDVLIVGHGAMNSAIICQCRNNPIAKFWDEPIENCKLKELGNIF